VDGSAFKRIQVRLNCHTLWCILDCIALDWIGLSCIVFHYNAICCITLLSIIYKISITKYQSYHPTISLLNIDEMAHHITYCVIQDEKKSDGVKKKEPKTEAKEPSTVLPAMQRLLVGTPCLHEYKQLRVYMHTRTNSRTHSFLLP
jgi:hypothetical protein